MGNTGSIPVLKHRPSQLQAKIIVSLLAMKLHYVTCHIIYRIHQDCIVQATLRPLYIVHVPERGRNLSTVKLVYTKILLLLLRVPKLPST